MGFELNLSEHQPDVKFNLYFVFRDKCFNIIYLTFNGLIGTH